MPPYRTPDGEVLIRLVRRGDPPPDGSVDSRGVVGPGPTLEPDVVGSHRLGAWHTVGRLIVDSLGVDERVPFDPMLHADPRLRPVRLLSGVREAAYRGSRRGRAADR